MKWLNGNRMRLVLIVFVAAIVLGGGSAYADFTCSTPIELGPPIWSQGHDPQGCCFSRDGLELYFSSNRPGGYGRWDIWVAERETVDALWGEPVNLGPNVNSPELIEVEPAISPDGLELYFTLYHDYNIRVCSRPSKDAPWSNPEVLGPPVGVHQEHSPEVSADGLSLYFASKRPGGYGDQDIWVSTRATTSDPWSEPINLGPTVNSTSYDAYPSISSDGLCLFFASERTGGWTGGHPEVDIWVTTRPSTDAEWGPPVNYPNLNSLNRIQNFDPAISPDGSVLYFETPFAMWQSSITPIVDLNGDGIVDASDMCIIVDYWGTDEKLCDIGPMPWGDGIVDVQDLIVLAERLFEEPGLVACWKLDETEGNIAYDSVDVNDGVVIGEAVWQPADGRRRGALQFDGIDDYVSTPFILNPYDGAFSVFAWIKGGAPGQVIVSQTNGTGIGRSWLCTDPSGGKLMTRLTSPPGRSAAPPPLLSEFVVTDGNWHRVGFVWDGSYRHLYFDGTEVARDTKSLTMLESADGGLYIGAGNTLDEASFFSGLVDDVRIYDEALSAEEIAALAQ